MTRYLRHGILMLTAILLVAGVQTVVAQDAAQKKGADLYASPVSYTHLDVYKRQVYSKELFRTYRAAVSQGVDHEY